MVREKPQTKAFIQVPSWNDVCADLHQLARDAFKLWCMNGKPRCGPIYHTMKTTRAHFKLILRQNREMANRKESDILAKQILHSDKKEFWTKIKKINSRNKSTPLAERIDG